MVRARFLLLFSAYLVLGCGDPAGADGPDAPPPADAGQPPPPSLEDRIEGAVERITADTCFAQDDTSGCDWADYDVGPTHVDMAVSTGEAILVIDSLGEGLFPQLVRYRNRILGVYRVNGDAIEAQSVTAHLPKQLGDALLSFAGPEFIPASLLGAVGDAASTAYGKLNLLFLGHGGIIFGHIVELAPEQPLVLLELSGFVGLLPSLCTGVDEPSLAAARAHFTAIASSLRQLMARHNVRFVNASFGDTVETTATDWTRTCKSAVPSTEVLRQLLHLYDPIYDALFNTDGVITANAAANLGDPLDFPFDQPIPQYRNRVRVGFISSLASGLDELGRGAVQKAEQFPRNGDADVYLNWDCETFGGCADPHYEMAGLFGLGTVAVTLMSTSYVNPLGLGRLINLRYANHGGEPMSNGLIQTLEQELTPSLCGDDGAKPCVYQDPIPHHQLEVYRQHYR